MSLALIVAAIMIGVESIVRIQTPHPLPEAYTLWVLLAVVGIKALVSRYVSSVGERIDSTAVRNDAWHHLSDAAATAVGALLQAAVPTDGAFMTHQVCLAAECAERYQA